MDRETEIAMVMLETHGSTTYPPEQWHGWRWCEANYCPEWLETELDQHTGIGLHTVLDFSLATAVQAPEGWKVVYKYAAGEKSCPWCGDGTGEEHTRSECKLCEGDGLLYWGEECQVVVFARDPDADETDDDNDSCRPPDSGRERFCSD